MDGSTFDALVQRALGNGSRRVVLRVGIGALAASALATFGLYAADDAQATKKGKGHRRGHQGPDRDRDRHARRGTAGQAAKKDGTKKKPCPPCKTRKQGKCKGKKPDGTPCSGGTCQAGRCLPTPAPCTPACEAGRTCQNAQCVIGCDSGQSECAGICVDLQTNQDNCGGCGASCASDQRCAGGGCVCDATACNSAGGCCDGTTCTPTDFQTDLENCGGCGTFCRFAHAGARCERGTCALVTCDAGYGDCDGQVATGCETNNQTDPDHCAVCGNACTGGDVCLAGVCTCLPAPEDLQAAVDAAKPGTTLRLCAGTWMLTRPLDITKDLTIVGAGVDQSILHGGDAVRVVQVIELVGRSATVTLQDLTITRGRAVSGWWPSPHMGGGIHNTGTLALVDVHVTSNTAEAGGGITSSGPLTLERTRVTNNRADFGGGIYHSTSPRGRTLRLQGSNISGNTAQYGGGLYTYDGIVLVEAVSGVTGNSAQKWGGGIYTHFSGVTVEASSSVMGNTAETAGGGIFNFDGTVGLGADNIVTDNHLADGTTVSNCAPVDTIVNCIG